SVSVPCICGGQVYQEGQRARLCGRRRRLQIRAGKMRPMRAAAAVLLGLIVAARPAAQQPRTTPRPAPKPAAPAEPRREAPVPFRIGEQLTFDVSWQAYLIAGTATTTVVEKRASFNST